jgi:phage shock protein A
MTRPRSPLARLVALIRGAFASFVREREERSPKAVYEQAILERQRHYAELKRAVAGILYMRNKLDGEIASLRGELGRLHDDIRVALRRGDDEAALVLVRHKQTRSEELERAEQDLEKVRTEAAEAKENLVRFREEIRALEREKTFTLAALANAHARRRIREAFEGFSLDGEMRALESVREYVAQLRTEGRLDQELDDSGLAARLREIRSDSRDDAARRELDELKRRLRPAVLPASAVVVTAPPVAEPVRAAAG